MQARPIITALPLPSLDPHAEAAAESHLAMPAPKYAILRRFAAATKWGGEK